MRDNDRRLLTALEMRELDRRAQEEYRIDGELLMENAGQKAWALLKARLPVINPHSDGTGRVVFVAGNGNNGGDVLVMARQCFVEGRYVPAIVTVRSALKGSALRQWQRLSALGLDRLIWEDGDDRSRELISTAEVIVDGITGIGIGGPLRPLEADLVAEINRSAARTVAIDIPSGMRDGGAPDEPTIIADETISTGHIKRLLYAPARRPYAGTISWVDPGFPEIAAIAGGYLVDTATYPRARLGMGRFSPDAHKGRRGRVLIVAGGEGTEGAAILAGLGAMNSGAGMVRVTTTGSACAAGVTREPGIMWSGKEPDEETVRWADAIVVGPGWVDATLSDLERVLGFVSDIAMPVVLDAAALRFVASWLSSGDRPGSRGLFRDRVTHVVLTPHPGELAELAGVAPADVLARPYAVLDTVAQRIVDREGADASVTIVLKASATIIRRCDGVFSVVDGRTPGLGVAGSGDVLAGMIGGYTASAVAGLQDAPSGPTEVTDAVQDAVVDHLLRGRRLSYQRGAFSAGDLATVASHYPDQDFVDGR